MATRTGRQPVGVDATGALAADVPCRGCGYNLRGLAPDGHCPECGRTIASSLQVWRTIERSGLTDFSFVRKLLRGIDLTLAALVLAVAGPLAYVLALKFGRSSEIEVGAYWTMLTLEVIACGLGGWGCWLLTSAPKTWSPLGRHLICVLLRWITLIFLAQCVLLFFRFAGLSSSIIEYLDVGIPITGACASICLKGYGVILADGMKRDVLGGFLGVFAAIDLLLLCMGVPPLLLKNPEPGLPFIAISVTATMILLFFLRWEIGKVARLRA